MRQALVRALVANPGTRRPGRAMASFLIRLEARRKHVMRSASRVRPGAVTPVKVGSTARSMDGQVPQWKLDRPGDPRMVGSCSSAGRALRSQRGGQRFDPAQLTKDSTTCGMRSDLSSTFVSLFVPRPFCITPNDSLETASSTANRERCVSPVGGATWPRTSPAFAEGASGLSGMDGKRWPPKGVSPHVDVGLRVGLELDLSFNDIRGLIPHKADD